MCTEDQFGCILTAECIPISWVCDKEIDCADASDEEYCTGKIQNKLYQRDFDLIHKAVLRMHYYCEYIYFQSLEMTFLRLILSCPIYPDGNNNDLASNEICFSGNRTSCCSFKQY